MVLYVVNSFNLDDLITTKFHACHNSYAVVACVKFCSDQFGIKKDDYSIEFELWCEKW